MKLENFIQLGKFWIYYHLPRVYSLGYSSLYPNSFGGKIIEFDYNTLANCFHGKFLNLNLFIQFGRGFILYFNWYHKLYTLIRLNYIIEK